MFYNRANGTKKLQDKWGSLPAQSANAPRTSTSTIPKLRNLGLSRRASEEVRSTPREARGIERQHLRELDGIE
jgi:hypothetical protein